ncbi:MAG: TIM-barrel domain-containing protein [Bacillota bacterium]
MFRDKDIPCDVIYLDIDYMDHYKCFTWGEAFQDYQDLIRDLHAQGFKIVTIINPGLKIEPGYHPYDSGVSQGMFIVDQEGSYVAKRVWAGRSHFPDFLNPSVQKWWGELVAEFVKSGVDGIWCDMNEPTTFDSKRTLPPDVIHKLSDTVKFPHERVHNLYGFLMSKATYEGLLKATHLPYVITRATYLGGQKYATTWTGDNVSNWEHFRASIPMILNLGLSGQPVVGPDIGGFEGTPSPELYERWILQGALYPYSRTHTRKGTNDQEPWSFGPNVETSARKAIKLRYQLVPYLYSLLFEATQNGQPIMRPIFYRAPTVEALKPEFYETEFLLGPSLLVAPLMDPAPARSCYLPPGAWFSWWCGKERKGGQIYQTSPEEDTNLPLFIRENAIIPMYPDAPCFIPNCSLKNLEILVAVKNQAEGMIVEYFDRESLLAYEVLFSMKSGYIEGKIYVKRQGKIPTGYQPPENLYIRLNYRIRSAEFISVQQAYSISSDSGRDSWTRITIFNPSFPLTGNFILDF